MSSDGHNEWVLNRPLVLQRRQGRAVRIFVDVDGNLIFQFIGESGKWETKKMLTPDGLWV